MIRSWIYKWPHEQMMLSQWPQGSSNGNTCMWQMMEVLLNSQNTSVTHGPSHYQTLTLRHLLTKHQTTCNCYHPTTCINWPAQFTILVIHHTLGQTELIKISFNIFKLNVLLISWSVQDSSYNNKLFFHQSTLLLLTL